MDIARKLIILQLKENGISQKTFDSLDNAEKAMLVLINGKYYLNQMERAKIKVGLIGGVFDILHIGHVFTLNEAKKHCDVLVVVVARDEMIMKKGRKLLHTQKYRAAMVESLKPVDVAVLGLKDYHQVLDAVKPDVIIYGYDQEEFAKPEGVKIIKLKKYIEPEKFKSSKIMKIFGL